VPTKRKNAPGGRLVIVESPAKARTVARYLGAGYEVAASVGHIRDLPTRAADIPAKYKDKPWSRLGVDVENGFEPLYVVDARKKKTVAELKQLLANADELYLATDEDREGEAIAWHLREVLRPRVPVRRMVFHEITQEAITRAVEAPRDINQLLVDAQETRRILDRLYGYEVSPVLWKKVMPRLSAGRVQSVATRLVVERERERMAFRSAEYWDLEGTFATGRAGDPTDPPTVTARLVAIDGVRVAAGRDFDTTGALRAGGEVRRLDESAANDLAAGLEGADVTVRAVEQRPYRRSPYAPFRTTTLQQEASRKLGFGASRTMQVAQALYENGYITYMRTDSVTLAESAVAAAREQAVQLYGADHIPETPRRYRSKVKNAQEAHEAVRPAGDTFRTPAETGLRGDEFRLYELIWQRTVASQMADATGQSVSVRFAAAAGGRSGPSTNVEFAASGKVITFPGFLRAYVEGADDPDAELDDRERRLPRLTEGDRLVIAALQAEEHRTKPPARYTEASLVSQLEEREIGRPSTYAAIMRTIVDRGYVFKRGTALVPAFLAFAVVGLLERHFPQLVDYDFTARMEDDLDRIAAGDAQMVPWLTRFYFGNGDGGGGDDDRPGSDSVEGLKALVSDLGDIDAREVNSIPVGEGIVVRVGRYGPYVERAADPGDGDGTGSQRASVPEDLPPDELTVAKARELLEKPSGDKVLGADPATGRDIVAREGRYGPYVTEVLPDDTADKPRTSSLFRGMAVETVTLDEALRLLTLPRSLGTAPDGEEVAAQNGRYGPYVKKGTDSRSLETEEQLFTVTLDEALALFAQPKARGRRAAAAAPLRELGPDPQTGAPVVVKEGRFGPYVTDGETNASLRKADAVETVTIERAAELLADRRARGPAPTKRAAVPRKKAPAPRKRTASARKS